MGQWGAKYVAVCVFWNIIVIVSNKVHAVGLQCNSCIIMHGMEYVKKKYPNGHYIYRQFNIQQFYVLPTQCIYVFCVDMRTNSDYFPKKATRPTHLIFLALISRTIFDEEYSSQSYTLCNFLEIPITSSHLRPIYIPLHSTLKYPQSSSSAVVTKQVIHKKIRYISPKNRPWSPIVGFEGQLYRFFNLGARWEHVVNATPWPLYPQERD